MLRGQWLDMAEADVEVGEVVVHLHVQPELGFGAEEMGQTKGGVVVRLVPCFF